MIALLQRVIEASVSTTEQQAACSGPGILALVAVVPDDSTAEADRLLQRILGYRIFPDDQGRMNLSLSDCAGCLLLVPQFTLAADTRKGMRPSFSGAAAPEQGERLFNYLVSQAQKLHSNVAAGFFGADMQVALINDGPVTFWLEARPRHANLPGTGSSS